ncbi:MAG: fimbrillin family protein, partial [Muribaculaceae bacterium]|nr:fimbrillin family protein [Muribaculaceae bacterium]
SDNNGSSSMSNVEVTYDGNWIPKGNYSWPEEGSMHIAAYSPYCEAPGENGIVAMPGGMEGESLPFVFSVASDISDQSDLLWAEPLDAHSSPCGLTFRHALTRLRFVAGVELLPLTISKIEIKNVYSKGKVNIATGEWSDLESLADFTVEPDLELIAQNGSQYVEPGVSLITDDDDDADEWFMIPQELGAESKIVITAEIDGVSTELEASAGGTAWREGKTVTYKLSTNPAKEGLQFEIEGDFSTPFTGGKVNFHVVSTYDNKGKSNPVEWIAEFTDGAGNVVDKPEWIQDFTMQGKGSGDYSYSAEVRSPVFNTLSPQSKALQNAQDVNDRSGHDPYNLANAAGAPEVMNTANTYIINAPGRYSLPLVYGNAVKNGMPNPSAYTSAPGDGRVLQNFINHRGDPITDPYIYNNSGCVPSDAGLVWEDRIGLISDAKLSIDGESILFEVPKDFIRQGNALLAVRDKSGDILWSWQIWVTDYNPEESNVKVKTDTGVRQMYSKSIGAVRGGDELTFPAGDAYVRFRQVNVPSGTEPLNMTVKLHQDGLHNTTVDYNTYYQWGRKDPIMGDKKRWFDPSHNELNELSMKSADRNVPEGKTLVECMIGSPSQFWKSAPGHKYRYNNLWNSGASEKKSVKTVYDPSPVGAKVPEGEFIRQLIKSSSLSWGTSGQTSGFFVSSPVV